MHANHPICLIVQRQGTKKRELARIKASSLACQRQTAFDCSRKCQAVTWAGVRGLSHDCLPKFLYLSQVLVAKLWDTFYGTCFNVSSREWFVQAFQAKPEDPRPRRRLRFWRSLPPRRPKPASCVALAVPRPWAPV